MSTLSNIRIVILVICIILSFVVLGISAHMLSIINDLVEDSGGKKVSSTAPITAATLSLVYFGSLFGVGIATKASTYVSIKAESIAFGVLWVLWLGTAGYTALGNAFAWLGGCKAVAELEPDLGTPCVEYNAIEAVCFIIWIILLGYWITIVAYSRISQKKGRNVWDKSIKEATSTENTKTEPVMMA